jgi:hypothetical protein
MHTILQVESGPAAGNKIMLAAGQILRVGRTEWADFAVPDPHVSGVHFSLTAEQEACYVQDLDSRNGTLVNRQPILGPTRVSDGDEVVAGETVFRVWISTPSADGATDGSAAAKASTANRQTVELPGSAFLDQAVPPPGPPVDRVCSRERCQSGLMVCRGEIEQCAPHELADRLAQRHPLYFIVDFSKLGAPPPPGAEYLFDWLDASVIDQASPAIVAAADWPEWSGLVEEYWGQDGLVGIFSRQTRADFVEHLRRLCQAKRRVDEPSGAVLGYCWPSVLVPLLSRYQSEFAPRFFEGIDLVLVEEPEQPERWHVFGQPGYEPLLERLGFRLQDTNPENPEQET